jgi:hypothetical protein
MSLHHITDLAGLHRHLQAAVQLEHATIPPYLTALYSIQPGTNVDAFHVIRAVAVEEMLHLTLAANILNAVGGAPDLTVEGFVPLFPAYLPDGETDFQVDCQAFSRAAIETFLKIERPAPPGDGAARTIRRPRRGHLHAGRVHAEGEEHFYSIGEFYKAIEQGLEALHAEMGDRLFSGDPARQITPEYYYSGGGGLIAVTDLASAKAAIRLISEQGEGTTDAIFDADGEIAHYYRFEQLLLGRFYQPGDMRGQPSGGPVAVDWEAVFPIKPNPRLSDYPEGSALRAGAVEFNRIYARFLALLTRAFRGERDLFIAAVGDMFRLKELYYQLMRQPIPGQPGLNAAPTYEITQP